jgi:hypothetical protein
MSEWKERKIQLPGPEDDANDRAAITTTEVMRMMTTTMVIPATTTMMALVPTMVEAVLLTAAIKMQVVLPTQDSLGRLE